jgi:hypothetical protein
MLVCYVVEIEIAGFESPGRDKNISGGISN